MDIPINIDGKIKQGLDVLCQRCIRLLMHAVGICTFINIFPGIMNTINILWMIHSIPLLYLPYKLAAFPVHRALLYIGGPSSQNWEYKTALCGDVCLYFMLAVIAVCRPTETVWSPLTWAGWVMHIHRITWSSMQSLSLYCWHYRINTQTLNTLRTPFSKQHFSDAFSWMRMLEFQLQLQLRVQLTIVMYWLRQWLGAKQVPNHYKNQFWPSLPTHICHSRGRWVKQLGHFFENIIFFLYMFLYGHWWPCVLAPGHQ